MKIKSKELPWFQTKIYYDLDQLLSEIKATFDHRSNKLVLQREFENQKYWNNKTFSNYYHEKIITRNCVLIDEEEMIDYIE